MNKSWNVVVVAVDGVVVVDVVAVDAVVIVDVVVVACCRRLSC